MTTTRSVSLLISGSEILDGRVQDTNTHYICRTLSDLGIPVAQVLVCDDSLSAIVSALQYLSLQSSLIIISGGLGPTTDDLTREAVAEFTSSDLFLDEDVLKALQERYQKRGRVLHATNNKQALRPKGSELIPNDTGTAPGFSLRYTPKNGGGERILFTLPGVPRELYSMFERSVLPKVKEFLQYSLTLRTEGFRIFGLPESAVGQIIEQCKLPQSVTVSYRAAFPEIHVRLKTVDTACDLSLLIAPIKKAIGEEYIFVDNVQTSLTEVIHQLLLKNKNTISVAESCTGGLVGSLLTKHPGASEYFLGGILAYANTAKKYQLSITDNILSTYGAVSFECAKEMATSVRQKFSSDIGLSITGIAGPDGGTPEKPVGTFYVGIATGTAIRAYHYRFSAERAMARTYEAYTAIDVVRRTVLGLPFTVRESLLGII